jgi:HlyD family secretion protein
MLLTSCTQAAPTPLPAPSPTPVPVIPLSPNGGALRAAGKVYPAQAAQLGFPAPGRVVSITVAVGDVVAAGDLLIGLDDTAAQATVAQAEAALARAQANLAAVQAGPRPPEIAAAQARLDAAQAHLDQLTAPVAPATIAAAQAALVAAQAYADALYGEPDAAVVAAAQARVAEARAALDRLLHPVTAAQIAEAEAQVRSAAAEVDLLLAAARPEAVAAASASVAEAEAARLRAQADLAQTQLLAPFAGTVAALPVNLGEMVVTGQPALTLADLSRLQVETSDLSERQVVAVRVGQAVTVFVPALGLETPGMVAAIAPLATVVGGDVVYAVRIDLAEQPPALRWGMSVDVEIHPE